LLSYIHTRRRRSQWRFPRYEADPGLRCTFWQNELFS